MGVLFWKKADGTISAGEYEKELGRLQAREKQLELSLRGNIDERD